MNRYFKELQMASLELRLGYMVIEHNGGEEFFEELSLAYRTLSSMRVLWVEMAKLCTDDVEDLRACNELNEEINRVMLIIQDTDKNWMSRIAHHCEDHPALRNKLNAFYKEKAEAMIKSMEKTLRYLDTYGEGAKRG